jgi:hypothetical protein
MLFFSSLNPQNRNINDDDEFPSFAYLCVLFTNFIYLFLFLYFLFRFKWII